MSTKCAINCWPTRPLKWLASRKEAYDRNYCRSHLSEWGKNDIILQWNGEMQRKDYVLHAKFCSCKFKGSWTKYPLLLGSGNFIVNAISIKHGLSINVQSKFISMDSHNTHPNFTLTNVLASVEVLGFTQRCWRITRTQLTWHIGKQMLFLAHKETKYVG